MAIRIWILVDIRAALTNQELALAVTSLRAEAENPKQQWRTNLVAKKALKKEKVEMQIRISKAEVKCIIWEKVNHEWQEMWDNEGKGRHLYQIQKSVKVNNVGSGNRKEEIVLTRLRLGHYALNKTLKMIGKHQTGLCEECQEEESVEHVILHCRR